jgi:tRNA methyl transferase
MKKWLVAISGGVDSVVLAHLLHSQGIEIVLAHCNFSLRGAESDADEAFVRQYAATLGVALEVVRFNTKQYAKDCGLNTQLAARELRYRWFAEMAKKHHCSAIATAHHANDNIETFIINLSRGSGLDGLLGIPQQTAQLVRPLLHMQRAEILSYAQQHGLQWREDSSNHTDKYVRNRIRHHITPQLLQVHPNFVANFQQTQAYLQQASRLIDAYIAQIQKQAFLNDTFPIKIAVKVLENTPERTLVLHKLFYKYGFHNPPDLEQLFFKAEAGKYIISATHQLVKDKDCVFLKERVAQAQEYTIERNTVAISDPIALCFNFLAHPIDNTPHSICIAADKLQYPLLLRHKREGDVFYPLGFGRKKKLSKFFIDEKYSQIARESQWLLCNGDGAIIWVVGKRMDSRFAPNDTTTAVLMIEQP